MRTRLQGPRFSCPQGSEFRGLLVSFGNPGGSAHHGPEGQSWKGKLAQPPEVEVWAEPTTLAAPEVLLRGLKAGAWGTRNPKIESCCGGTQDLSDTGPRPWTPPATFPFLSCPILHQHSDPSSLPFSPFCSHQDQPTDPFCHKNVLLRF